MSEKTDFFLTICMTPRCLFPHAIKGSPTQPPLRFLDLGVALCHICTERATGSSVCDMEHSEMALLSGAVSQTRNGDEPEFNYVIRNCFN